MDTDYLRFKLNVEQEQLIPNLSKPGEFIRDPYSNGVPGKFLSPNNWVFHDNIVDKVSGGKYLEIMPYSAEFVTTMNCTNRCRLPCSFQVQRLNEGIGFHNDFANPITHMQSMDYARDLLNKLIDGGIRGMIFTGGGEPFLFKHLEDLVAHTTSRGVDSVVYTNGNIFSQKRIEKLVEASPLLVRVSQNAGTEEEYLSLHDPLNPKGAFDRVLSTVYHLAKNSLKNKKTRVGVSFAINELNQGSIADSALRLREIVEKTGGGINFATYRPAYDYYGGKQLSEEFLDKTYEIVEKDVKKILEGTGIEVSNIKCRYDALKDQNRGYEKCRATGLYAELSPSGDMGLCCDRNCHRAYRIGNLNKNSLEEIWKSELRKNMIDYIDAHRCNVCPPACKPHETNKQFEEIEIMRKKNEFYKVMLWIEKQRAMPKPRMVNF
jgi:MoaA/NifB/PqqE/SkfB family radical SAM enzyme